MAIISNKSKSKSNVYYREALTTDIRTCFEIESASYPVDEAASLEKLHLRQSEAQPFFRLCCTLISDNESIIGFVCGTLCQEFTEESMLVHDSGGELLAIHSVVVRQDHRRMGYATGMLLDYVSCMKDNHLEVKKLVLIAKQHLMRFYVSCGFRALGLSAIIHGQDPWFDHELDLNETRFNHTLNFGEPFWVVDSFADRFGAGNPAAVVLLNSRESRDEFWMQTVAREFNLSETAFVKKIPDSNTTKSKVPNYRIQFFTPTVQVSLCGHATLASAAALFEKVYNNVDNIETICFQTINDVSIEVAQSGEKEIMMEFPWKDVLPFDKEEETNEVSKILSKGFGINSIDISFIGLGCDEEDLLIEVTEQCFKSLDRNTFDMNALMASSIYTRGIILCCQNSSKDHDSDADFQSRFFGPKAGIPEDPVTGSAHCLLAPYFGKLLGIDKMVGRQASLRGGIVKCTLQETSTERSVVITGPALFASEGNLYIR